MQNYEKYYTKNITDIIAVIRDILPKDLFFIDTSCGDNCFSNEMLKNNLIENYIAYDISPPINYDGIINIKDWLKEDAINNEINDNETAVTLIGFNPPYGFGSKKAKKFIYKGFLEKHKYCIWLVPISLKLFLLKLYKPLFQKEYISLPFIDINGGKEIKQSVLLFVGERLNVKNHKSIFLSRLKNKIISKNNYILKRTHNEGIREDATILLKKTGNPVFFPSFYKPEITKNIWWQINKTGIVYKKASLEKQNGKFIMNGKKITKHLNNDHKYAVDSNIYVKLSKLKDIEKLINRILVLGNSKEFYDLVNVYKPAAITIGWLREFLDEKIN